MTNYTITNNDYFKSIEITFNEKPSDDVRNILKALHFRWHYTKKVWYGYTSKQTLTEKLNSVLNPVNLNIEKVNPVLRSVKNPSINIDLVTVDLQEKKTESLEGFNNHNASKTIKYESTNKKLLKKQEKALMNLLNYDRNMCVYAAKNGIAFIGNPYVLFKINTELFSSDFIKQVKETVELTGRTQNFDSFEKVFNKAYKTVNTDAATIYLTSKDTFTETVCKDIKGNKISTVYDNEKRVITFNSRLLKNCLATFNSVCELTVLEAFKPAIVNGENFTALIMPIRTAD